MRTDLLILEEVCFLEWKVNINLQKFSSVSIPLQTSVMVLCRTSTERPSSLSLSMFDVLEKEAVPINERRNKESNKLISLNCFT